ncbi:MAG: thiamine phosphate synthase [Candidatus Thiodiazotropha sp. (ex Monitilora ramsayi)]|nr:thiamine phosphate synthase [Candidatus Thiodiazotropha sp. (ex Monitilora ramsayi)]
MNDQSALRGLYAITDPSLCPDEQLTAQVREALEGGTRVIQYRDKRNDREIRHSLADQLLILCRRYGALLIINDDVTLAAEIGAHGVHLGRDDAELSQARRALGRQAVIGVSCYNRPDLALTAAKNGADYVAFGRFFPSQTKPNAVQAAPDLLREAKRTIDLPLVAIGGITPENGAPLIEAGADMLAVVHGVFGQADIRSACRLLTNLFEPKENTT